MATLNFPSDTSQTPYEENGYTYEWDGEKWNITSSPGGGGGGSDYVLPVATDVLLGGVKVGSRLTIAGDGTLSADIQGGGGGTTVGNLQEVTDEGNTTDNEILIGTDSTQQIRIAPVGAGANARAIITSRNPSTATDSLNTFNVEKDGVETMRIEVDGSTKIGGTPSTSPNLSLIHI